MDRDPVNEATGVGDDPSRPDTASTTPWRHRWPLAIGLTVAVIADLASKAWIFAGGHGSPGTPLWLASLQDRWSDVAWIVPRVNTGVAWSMLDHKPGLVLALTLTLIPLLLWYYWAAYRSSERRLEHLGFGTIIGGALGNCYDRLLAAFDAGAGGVRDFIHVDLQVVGIDYIWPTFNIADSAITVGLGLLAIGAVADMARRTGGTNDAQSNTTVD